MKTLGEELADLAAAFAEAGNLILATVLLLVLTRPLHTIVFIAIVALASHLVFGEGS